MIIVKQPGQESSQDASDSELGSWYFVEVEFSMLDLKVGQFFFFLGFLTMMDIYMIGCCWDVTFGVSTLVGRRKDAG